MRENLLHLLKARTRTGLQQNNSAASMFGPLLAHSQLARVRLRTLQG